MISLIERDNGARNGLGQHCRSEDIGRKISMLPDLEKASSCATQDKNVSNLTPRYFSGLADCFHDTTEYPGLPASGGQFLRAVQRYHFARLFAQGKRVLEVACGAGLGLGYLAHDASEVVGGDIDRLNLATAAATYASGARSCRPTRPTAPRSRWPSRLSRNPPPRPRLPPRPAWRRERNAKSKDNPGKCCLR